MPACCNLVDEEVKPFKSISERWCTDVWCLFIFVVYFVVMIALGVFSLGQGNLNYLLYPSDYLGQFCGYSSDVAGMSKAYYPQLDTDIQEQMELLTSVTGFYNFRPYTLCVEECPAAYNLAEPEIFGGASYPGANGTTAESFYTSFSTQEVFSRCLPLTETGPSSTVQLCTLPACNTSTLWDMMASSDLDVPEGSCVTIDSQPTVTTAWEVSTSTGEALCEFQVTEQKSSTFLPKGANAESKMYEQLFAAYLAEAFSVVKSITDNSDTVLIMGVAAPFVFAGGWFLFLFFFAGIIIVLALLAFLVILLATFIFFCIKAGWADVVPVDLSALVNYTETLTISYTTESDIPQSWYAVLAVVSGVLVLIYIILLIMWREAISRCIAIVREVTTVFKSLPLMMAYPLVGVLWYALVIAYGVAIGGFIATSTEKTYSEIAAAVGSSVNSSYVSESSTATTAVDDALDTFTSLDESTQKAVLMAVHVVGCIWALFIVQMSVYTTLSRACAVWFFNHGYSNPDDNTSPIVPKMKFLCGFRVLIACAWCVFSKHIGSIAFGAAILTIVTVIRMILLAIDYYTKQSGMQDGENGFMLKIVLKCVQCCMYCLDKTVRAITFFGLIFVAVEGVSFCSACWKTMAFWMKYPAQVAVNKLVAKILSVVISLSIPVGCAFIGYVLIDQEGGYEPIWAALAIGVCSFVIASSITDVFRCAIDTIFICAFYDLEENQPPKHMSDSLQEGFNVHRSDRKNTVAGPTFTKSQGGGDTELVNESGGAGRTQSVSGKL